MYHKSSPLYSACPFSLFLSHSLCVWRIPYSISLICHGFISKLAVLKRIKGGCKRKRNKLQISTGFKCSTEDLGLMLRKHFHGLHSYLTKQMLEMMLLSLVYWGREEKGDKSPCRKTTDTALLMKRRSYSPS